MKLSDIKIRDSFKQTLPNQSKLDDCRDYFKRHGCIDRELVLNKFGYLIDGYVGYLVLLENGVAETDVVVRSGQHSTSTYRNSDTTYVFGYHTVSGKEYVWRLSKNKVDHIDAVAKNGRYIVYQVYNFTRQKFSELTNCRFGWMEREDVHSGEIFEPSTVEMCMDVNAESTVAIPVIFDCKERKFIWCDMNLGIENSRSHYFGNNLESNLSGVTATCYGMTHLNKANIYDLVN